MYQKQVLFFVSLNWCIGFRCILTKDFYITTPIFKNFNIMLSSIFPYSCLHSLMTTSKGSNHHLINKQPLKMGLVKSTKNYLVHQKREFWRGQIMYKFQEHKGFLWLKTYKIICKFLVFVSWFLIFKVPQMVLYLISWIGI